MLLQDIGSGTEVHEMDTALIREAARTLQNYTKEKITYHRDIVSD
jgi:hypothetical protein